MDFPKLMVVTAGKLWVYYSDLIAGIKNGDDFLGGEREGDGVFACSTEMLLFTV